MSPCMLAGQKRAPDLITDGCEPPRGCWELNSGPLEKQSMLLTSEPSLQPPKFFKIYLYTVYTVFCLHVRLQARRGHQISLQMVVSHHVVAGN